MRYIACVYARCKEEAELDVLPYYVCTEVLKPLYAAICVTYVNQMIHDLRKQRWESVTYCRHLEVVNLSSLSVSHRGHFIYRNFLSQRCQCIISDCGPSN